MGKAITQVRSILAASQFVGTEFSVGPVTRGAFLRLKELDLQMGTEAKTFRIEKRSANGSLRVLIQQSVDNAGAPATTLSESVILLGSDIEVLLEPGEQIQIVTTGATSVMTAKLYLEEVSFQ